MKKYLMTSVAVLAFAATFTGCSKAGDLYDEGAIEKEKAAQKTASFEEAFKNRYGEIDKNNDWGFGSIGVATTRSAVEGRANAYTDYHSFTTAPDAPDASVFKSVPTGVAYLGDFKDPWGGYQLYHFDIPDNTAWLDAAAIANCGMKFDRYSYTIYVKGEVVATNDIYFKAGSKLYLTEGAKLTLPGTEYSFGQANVEIYVAEGAELICNGKLQFSGSKLINNGTVNVDELDIVSQYNAPASVYNCSKGVIKVTKDITMSKEGTFIANDHNIEAKNISVTSGSLVYNNEGARLTLSGTLGIENNNCEVINKGTLNAETLNTHGSAHFVNEDTGIVVIEGETNVDSNNDTWVNNGQYTTNNFTYYATSSEVINNCKLTVNNRFYIGLSDSEGDFKLDGSIITRDLELHGPANIRMTSNSVIKVSNTATMAITKPNYGIYGPASGDDAVFEANNIVWESKNNYCVSYFGNLYVVADSHFEHSYLDGTSDAAQANGGVGNCPTYYFDPNTVKMYVNGAGKPNYTIASSVCNPGFGGDDNNITYAVRIICEDLGASDDFDFNDVVFDAFIDKAANKTYIKVLAAGGTLPLTVGDDEHEVHAIFNVGTSTMVNTQKDAHYATKTDNQEFVINKAFDSYKDIPVKVAIEASAMTPETYNELKAEKGAAPQKIAVSTTFEWCDERQQIEDKYTNFTDYVNNSATLWQ